MIADANDLALSFPSQNKSHCEETILTIWTFEHITIVSLIFLNILQDSCRKQNTTFDPHRPKQARKLQATLEGYNPKLLLTYSLADGGKV